MDFNPPPWKLGELAKIVGGTLHGDPEILISRPTNALTEDPTGISFAESKEFLQLAEENPPAAILLSPKLTSSIPYIHVENTRQAFGMLLHLAHRPLAFEPGIHPTAVIHPTATVEEGASICPYVVIGANSTVGADSILHPFTSVGENCTVGEKCVLYPHAVLVAEVHLGNHVIIHSGSVLGADGFGYYWDGKQRVKIPQVGRVEIADSVEIGALTAIDRATAGSTSIGAGTKLDNFCQVAHNVKIGEHNVIAARAGFGGSSRMGSRIDAAGSIDINTNVEVGDDIVLAGRTGITKSLTEKGIYFGLPAMPIRLAQKVLILQQRLPELFDRLVAVEKKLAEPPE